MTVSPLQERLTKQEILRIVDDYIGAEAGNLQEFSFRSLQEFYPRYCGVDVPIDQASGTKRGQFISILESSDSRTQTKILRGLLTKLPKESRPNEDQQQLGLWIEGLVTRLEGSVVTAPTLDQASEVVRRALDDAETLVRNNDPVSAVDRVHTALHGYIKQVCVAADMDVPEDASLPQLWKQLRQQHCAFGDGTAHGPFVNQIVNALAQAIGSLGSIRNRGSMAHPNESLVGVHEAILVRNAAHSILTYVDARVRNAYNEASAAEGL